MDQGMKLLIANTQSIHYDGSISGNGGGGGGDSDRRRRRRRRLRSRRANGVPSLNKLSETELLMYDGAV
ncbi:unnamed protein product [Echinostoma caproni]|uniref:Uncharacterized protein n=1 Tax=Echinostoma caproni TaxID=27848 RepID=A0A183A4Y7_9TREM|nr:unnamed protein product [Echinostoma caproni]